MLREYKICENTQMSNLQETDRLSVNASGTCMDPSRRHQFVNGSRLQLTLGPSLNNTDHGNPDNIAFSFGKGLRNTLWRNFIKFFYSNTYMTTLQLVCISLVIIFSSCQESCDVCMLMSPECQLSIFCLLTYTSAIWTDKTY